MHPRNRNGERPKRGRQAAGYYSETKRRKKGVKERKRPREWRAYMTKGNMKRPGKRTIQKSIVVGEVTLDRITGDKYEWRDGRLSKRRRRGIDQTRVYDDGG